MVIACRPRLRETGSVAALPSGATTSRTRQVTLWPVGVDRALEWPALDEPARHRGVQRAVQLGDVSANPGADLRIAAAVLGGVDVQAADDLLGARPLHGEREANALGEVARVSFQVPPVGLKRHALDRRPSPRLEAGRRADVHDARCPRRVVGLVVLHTERDEVELGQLQLPRRIEFVWHERLSAHGARGYRWTRRGVAGAPPPCAGGAAAAGAS